MRGVINAVVEDGTPNAAITSLQLNPGQTLPANLQEPLLLSSWEYMGELPYVDAVADPTDGQIMQYSAAKGEWEFQTVSSSANTPKVIVYDAQSATGDVQQNIQIPLPGGATKFVRFDMGGKITVGAASLIALTARENGNYVNWHDMILSNDCDVHLTQFWHGQIAERLKFQNHSAGNPNGEFAPGASAGVPWTTFTAALCIDQTNWTPANKYAWTLEGELNKTGTHTTLRTQMHFVGDSDESFKCNLSMFSTTALTNVTEIGFALVAGVKSEWSGIIEYL